MHSSGLIDRGESNGRAQVADVFCEVIGVSQQTDHAGETFWSSRNFTLTGVATDVPERRGLRT